MLSHDMESAESGEAAGQQWLLPVVTIRKSMQELWDLPIHNSFAAYLCLRQLAAREGTTLGLQPSWRPFFEEFFAVPGGPEGQPYLRPFSGGSRGSRWLNSNLAGSFARSSLREGQPFSRVIEIEGAGRAARYNLRRKHWEKAAEHLLGGRPIPVSPLAVFLYRDYPLISSGRPNLNDLVGVFRDEFGYGRDDQGEAEFATLHEDDSWNRSDLNTWEPV